MVKYLADDKNSHWFRRRLPSVWHCLISHSSNFNEEKVVSLSTSISSVYQRLVKDIEANIHVGKYTIVILMARLLGEITAMPA